MAESFARLLKRHRVGDGLSQEAFAERAGVSVDAISYLEAAEYVCAGERLGGSEIAGFLASLVDKSLVTPSSDSKALLTIAQPR
jgi:transcriptional regulator with XRE-family HTH domain